MPKRHRANDGKEGRVPVTKETGLELTMTQGEIAARLGVTRSWVSQIERRALRKMRAEADRLGIRFEELFS
jgi:transcriptional regulator